MRSTLTLLAIAWTIYSYITVVIPQCAPCTARTAEILNGTALSPFAYRVLTPALLSVMGNTLSANVLFHALMFALFYVLLSAWLDRWRVSPLALLLPALMFPVMFEAWFESVYAITEAVLLLIGLLLTPRYTRWYPALVIVGTLNREMTGVLLVLIFWALCGDWKRTAVYALLAALAYGAVRVGVGARTVELTMLETFQQNIYSWRTVPALLKQLLFVPLWVTIATRFRVTPEPLRRLVIVSAVYFVLFLIGAMWAEIRLLLPVVVLTLPIVAKAIE